MFNLGLLTKKCLELATISRSVDWLHRSSHCFALSQIPIIMLLFLFFPGKPHLLALSKDPSYHSRFYTTTNRCTSIRRRQKRSQAEATTFATIRLPKLPKHTTITKVYTTNAHYHCRYNRIHRSI